MISGDIFWDEVMCVVSVMLESEVWIIVIVLWFRMVKNCKGLLMLMMNVRYDCGCVKKGFFCWIFVFKKVWE